MKKLNYINAYDIARRLAIRKRFWFHGKPKISLIGYDKQFGQLSFDFGDDNISFNVRIGDRDWILNAAQDAILNFNKHVMGYENE